MKILSFYKQYRFFVHTGLIVFIAAVFRYYSYFTRWGLAYDQAHDAIIARYALEYNLIPLLGPFSSAGPFQTGGEWYWIIMLGTAIFPWAVSTPWIFLTTLYVLFVLGIILLGRKMVDEKFGYILGLLAAFSPAQIVQGVNLTNQTPQSLVSLIAITFSFLYLQKKEVKYLFFLALTVGIGASIHLQGVGVIPLLVLTFLFARKYNIKTILAAGVGFLIPWLPVFLVDVQYNFFTLKNMLTYYLKDQYNISMEVLGRRWKTYIGILWPEQWGYITGGNKIFGGIGFFLIFPFVFFQSIKSNRSIFLFTLFVSFACSLILLRYTRTPLFESYFVFLHPFVLILTASMVYYVWNKYFPLGLFCLVLLLGGSFTRTYAHITSSHNQLAKDTQRRVDILKREFTNDKFHVRAYQYKWNDVNSALSLYLYKEGMTSENGRNISVVIATRSGEFDFPVIEGNEQAYQLLDLNSSTSAQLEKKEWVSVSPESFYRETQNWFKYHD